MTNNVALSKLIVSENLDKDRPIIVKEIPKPSIEMPIFEILPVEKVSTWFTPIWEYLTRGILPSDALLAQKVRRTSPM
jgi:hypothetical protein